MSFSCSNLSSPSFVRGALHASSSSKTHKTKAAFAVRAADDGTSFIKPILRAFFRFIASKSAKNEEGRDVGVEKRTHPKKTRFPPRAKEATRTSRRGRVDGLSPRARTIFCTSLVEKKPQKRITFCGTEGQKKKEGPPPALEKKDVFRSTRRGGAVYLFSERIQ